MPRATRPAAPARQLLPYWLEVAMRGLLVSYAILVAAPLRWHVVQPGLDGSWAFALNLFAARGLWHGRDVAFTYGPWAYLALPMPGGPPLWQALAAQTGLWILFGVLLLILAFGRRVPLVNLLLFVLGLVAGLNAFHIFGYSGPDLFFALLGLLALGCALEGRWWRVYLGGAILSGAALLMVKLSSGILVLSAAAAFPCALWRFDRARARQAAVMVLAAPLLLAALFLLHAPSPAALWGYLRAGVEITSGYSAAMSEGESIVHLWAALWVALALLFLAGVLWRQGQRAAILAAALAGPLFLAFKHSMVRPAGHAGMFFYFAAFAGGLVLLFTRFERNQWRLPALAAALLAAALYPHAGHAFIQPALAQGRSLGVLLDWRETSRQLTASSEAILAAQRLPSALLARLAGRTYSIFPWELTWAAAQPDTFRAFPVFQSYQAYTSYLDEGNAEFLRDAARAPELIVFDWAAIDGRHPLLDVPAVNLALYQHYDAVGRFGTHLLLQRRAAPRFSRLRSLGIRRVSSRKPFVAPAGEHPLLARIRLRASLAGRLRGFFYRLADVRMLLSGPDGTGISARVPPDVLANGIALNFAASGLDSQERLLSGAPIPAADAFELFGPGLGSFGEEMEVELLELPELRLARMGPPGLDTDAGVSATSRFEIVNRRGASQYGAGEVIGIPAAERFLTVSGYAIDGVAGAPGSAVHIELDGEARVAEYGLESHGIAIAMGKQAYARCGFRWMTPLWRLAPGPHRLRIILVSAGGDRHYVSADEIRVEVRPGTLQ